MVVVMLLEQQAQVAEMCCRPTLVQTKLVEESYCGECLLVEVLVRVRNLEQARLLQHG